MRDLEAALRSVAGHVGAFEYLLYGILMCMGLGMIVLAVKRAQARANDDPRVRSYVGPAMTGLFGCVLFAFPSTVAMLNLTLWGRPDVLPPDAIFAYAPSLFGPVDTKAKELIKAIVIVVQFLGMIALVRSIMLFNEHAQGPGESRLGMGLTFLLAGTVATNFPLFAGVLEDLVAPSRF